LAVVAILLSALSVFLPSGSAADAEGLDDLQALLQRAVDASGFDVTVAVTDLQTGESAAVRGDEPRLSGCTINVLVLIQATIDMQAGLLERSQVDYWLRETIYSSNPHTSRQLVFLLGGGDVHLGITRVRELATRLELSNAVFDHPPAYDDDSLVFVPEPVEAAPGEAAFIPDPDAWIVPDPRPPVEAPIDEPPLPAAVPDNVISPLDMNRVLAALWHGQLLDPEWTSYLLERLTRVSPGLQYLVASSGRDSAVVSHKNGYYWTPHGWTDNDVGIVRFWAGGKEHAYAVSYYAAGLRAELGDVVIGQRLMRIVWDYFRARYPAS
jgi:hypothetical protein